MLFPLNPYTRSRTQTITSGENPSYSYVNTQYSGTTSDPWRVISTTSYSGSQQGYVKEEMHDCETPEWRKLFAQRNLATVNPYEHERIFFNRGVGSYHTRRINRSASPPYTYSGSQNLGTTGIGDSHLSNSWSYPTQPSVDDSVIAEAITEAWSKVTLRDTMILATAGELHKTLSFIISIFGRLLKIVRALRKLDVKALAGELSPKELAQRYMEARYAIRPMMYDVKTNLEAFANKVPARYTTFRGFKAEIVGPTYDHNFLCRAVVNDYELWGTSEVTRTLEVRSGVLTMVKEIGAFVRFGSFDIIQSAWELVPFSFIVDWFFQVGKLISMWSPKVGLDVLASWYVVTDTTTLSVTAETGISKATGYNYTNFYNRQGVYSKVLQNKYRMPNPDRPILPVCNVRLNKLKLLDLGIILTGLANAWFGGKARKSKPRANYGYAWFDD